MSLIDRWYQIRHRRKNTNDFSDEITEEEDGVKRTITRFPNSAFLSYEEQRKIIEEKVGK